MGRIQWVCRAPPPPSLGRVRADDPKPYPEKRVANDPGNRFALLKIHILACSVSVMDLSVPSTRIRPRLPKPTSTPVRAVDSDRLRPRPRSPAQRHTWPLYDKARVGLHRPVVRMVIKVERALRDYHGSAPCTPMDPQKPIWGC